MLSIFFPSLYFLFLREKKKFEGNIYKDMRREEHVYSNKTKNKTKKRLFLIRVRIFLRRKFDFICQF